jgi:hypothetical protein
LKRSSKAWVNRCSSWGSKAASNMVAAPIV